MPLIPIILYGGTAALVGGTAYGAYRGASESTRAVMIIGALTGLGYIIYKKGR